MRLRCLVIAVAFLAANASDSWGQSKRPPPDRNQTQRGEQPAAADQRGTPQSPAIVKILPPEDSETKAKQEAEDRAAKGRLDSNTIRLGIIGIVVAALQFLGITLQAAFLWGTLKATASAADAAQSAAKIANDNLILANPPKLIVRDVVLWQSSTFQSTFSGDFEGFKEGEKLDGHLVVVNVGGTPAKIEFIDKMVYWTDSHLPLRRPYDNRTIERLDPPIVIPAGEGRQITPISCPKPMGPEAREVTTSQNKWRLYVMGWIRYRDGRGVQTHMKFCREWHYPDERFRAVSDDHYESER